VLYRSLKLLSLIFLSLLVLSCSCVTPNPKKSSGDTLVIPRASFVKIDVDLVIRECSEDDKTCELKRNDFISGSGFVAGKGRYKGSYVMSAGHVCDPSAYAKVLAAGQPWFLEFSGITKEGDEYKMHVLEVDNDKDLCLLYAPSLERIPIKIASAKLLPGSRIWNVAAPRGILYKGAPIIIDGIFNGTNQESGHDMYTMLVAGGSSGSAIISENGEVVGLVSMMDLRFPFIVYSPSHEDLYEFFYRAIAYHENIGAPAHKIYKIVLPELPDFPDLPKIEFPKIPDLTDIVEDWLEELI
jgi:hypothetical protein